MWYWIAFIVGYSLVMGWGLAKGEVPEAKPLSFIAGVWMIIGLAISLSTIVTILDKLQSQTYGWDLLPILSMVVLVMGGYCLSVQVLMDKSESITYNYYSRLRREQRREDERQREAVRQELIRAKDDPAFIAYVFEE